MSKCDEQRESWPTSDRIDVIGRNGNTGEHYAFGDVVKMQRTIDDLNRQVSALKVNSKKLERKLKKLQSENNLLNSKIVNFQNRIKTDADLAIKLIRAGKLTQVQIADHSGVPISKVRQLYHAIKSENK